MSNSNATANASTGGIGFFSLLTIVLVVLKAMGYINWSWWLVFSPMLIGFGIGLLFMLIFFAIILTVAVAK